MGIQRIWKSWFELPKPVVDDYGHKIGANGLAVYVCMVRLAQDDATFEIEDLELMLALEESEVSQAIENLINAGVLIREPEANGDGTITTHYHLVDLTMQYYRTHPVPHEPEVLPKPEIQQTPVKTSPACKGFVYVVEGEGYFKIGCTTNLNQRIKALTVKAPFDLVVHLVIPSLDIYTTEQELHRRFAKKHRRGEWFNLDMKDIEDIRSEYQVLDPAFLAAE